MKSKRPKQMWFDSLKGEGVKHFGGSHLNNSHAKSKRPISIKRCMHLVMRSSVARGEFSLLKSEQEIKRIIARQGRRFGVKVYRQANGGNHLHLMVLPASRKSFNGFIRAVSGLVARLVLKAERGNGQAKTFWDQRPFTRIIEWGREFRTVSSYLLQNTLEALGFVPFLPRRHRFVLSTA